jgi:hypothetical protein
MTDWEGKLYSRVNIDERYRVPVVGVSCSSLPIITKKTKTKLPCFFFLVLVPYFYLAHLHVLVSYSLVIYSF